jgi:hypothetical protein
MKTNGRFNSRRPLTLLAVAALLMVAGLLSAISAPGAPPHSNKADAYGGPRPTEPKNPKNRAACDNYYGAANDLPDARECRAKAKRYAGTKKCGKKKSAAERAKCKKAVNKGYAKEHAAIAKQRKAQKKCTDKYNADLAALDSNDDHYAEKAKAADDAYNTCMKATRGS